LANKWSFINKNGIIISPFFYDEVNDFSEGLAAVKKQDKWGFINKNGELIINAIYEEVYDFDNGLAAAFENGSLLGYIDKDGKQYWED